jgi:hypothetical protein
VASLIFSDQFTLFRASSTWIPKVEQLKMWLLQ